MVNCLNRGKSIVEYRLLLEKVQKLEERIEKLEERLSCSSDTQDKELMDAIYKKAKELVERHGKVTAIFLQRKLLIDYPRARALLKQLQAEGVV